MKYELKLEFEQDEDEILEKINKLLGALPLTSCRMEDQKCRTYKRTTYENDVEKSVDYGLDIMSCTLVCERSDEEDEAVFQIETAAFPAEENVEPRQFMEDWKKNNPEKVFRGMTALQYTSAIGFIVFCSSECAAAE